MNSETQPDVESFRYSGDKPIMTPNVFAGSSPHLRKLAANGLQITPELLPTPYKILQNCLNVTGLIKRDINVYVYAPPDSNAFCFPSGSDTINLAISSSLINNLDESELAFVFGHELGHVLFGHLDYIHVQDEHSDFLKMREMRAREISADRVGFICAKSVQSSVSAMIKLVSGVNESHLLLDVASYLEQCQTLRDIPATHVDFLSTHPPMPVRARALLWFSMSETYFKYKAVSVNSSIAKPSVYDVDDRVSKDMNRYVDRGIDERFRSEKMAFRMFFLAYHLSLNGRFSRQDQELLRKHCGGVVEKLFNVVQNSTTSGVSNMLASRLQRPLEYMRLYSSDSLLREISDCANILGISQAKAKQTLSRM